MKIISIITLLTVCISCQKSIVQSITVTTENMHSITSTSIIISGHVEPYQLYQSTNTYNWGVCYDTTPNVSINNYLLPDYTDVNDFEVELTNLTPNTQYYARAYFSNQIGTYYGLECSYKTPSIEVGEFKEGGIVFWIDPEDSSHGLVCAIVDQGVNQKWGSSNFNVPGADGIEIGSGHQNTMDIQSDQSSFTTPSDLCLNLNINGHDDWFLPSLNELKVLLAYKFLINNTLLTVNGTILEQDYWTSSEVDNNYVWGVSFEMNNVSAVNKGQNLRTRAIRTF